MPDDQIRGWRGRVLRRSLQQQTFLLSAECCHTHSHLLFANVMSQMLIVTLLPQRPKLALSRHPRIYVELPPCVIHHHDGVVNFPSLSSRSPLCRGGAPPRAALPRRRAGTVNTTSYLLTLHPSRVINHHLRVPGPSRSRFRSEKSGFPDSDSCPA